MFPKGPVREFTNLETINLFAALISSSILSKDLETGFTSLETGSTTAASGLTVSTGCSFVFTIVSSVCILVVFDCSDVGSLT